MNIWSTGSQDCAAKASKDHLDEVTEEETPVRLTSRSKQDQGTNDQQSQPPPSKKSPVHLKFEDFSLSQVLLDRIRNQICKNAFE